MTEQEANDGRPRAGRAISTAAWIAALAIVALLVGARFHGYAFDDPFISYRVARNIASGDGFVYKPGERVNAVTNPLYTLLLAGLYRATGLDPPILGAMVSVAGMFMASLLIAIVINRERAPAGWIAGLIVIIHPMLISCMGMETGLLMALLAAGLLAYSRDRMVLAGALLGLATIARMDASLMAGVVFIHFTITRKKLPVAAALSYFLAVLPWLIFSVAYFGELLPHTLAVKTAQVKAGGHWGGQWIFLEVGAKIVRDLFGRPDLIWLILAPVLAAGVVGALRQGRTWPRLILAWALLHFIAYAFIIRAPAYTWYFAPVAAGLAVLLGLGAVETAGALKRLKMPYLIPLVLAAACLLIWALASAVGIDSAAGALKPIDFGHIIGYAALLATAALLLFPGLRNRRAAMTAAALVLALAAFVPRHWVGLLKLTHQPTSQYFYYFATADWINVNQPEAKTVGAHEIGALGYFLPGKTIIDQCGIPTPGAARRLGQGDSVWWIKQYRPDLIVLHPSRDWWQATEGQLLAEPWFGKAYRRVAVVLEGYRTGRPIIRFGPEVENPLWEEQVGKEIDKHATEVWKLIDAGAIPPA